jgi:hypothetical protein
VIYEDFTTLTFDLDVHAAGWSDRGSTELVHGLWRRTGASKDGVSGRSIVLHVKVERGTREFEKFHGGLGKPSQLLRGLRKPGSSPLGMTVNLRRDECAEVVAVVVICARSCSLQYSDRAKVNFAILAVDVSL